MTKLTKFICLFFLSLVLIFFIHKVFAGYWILPQYFSIGPIAVHYYGIFMALAVGAGYWLAMRRLKLYNIQEGDADNIIFWTVVGGFFGARLYHVLSSLDYYTQHPIDIIKVWNGGLSIYGAVLGGITPIVVVKKFFTPNSSLLTFLDWLAPSVILGQIIGRVGNFFNYELYGYPTNLPWKMFVPSQFRLPGFIHHNFFHPLFLYEALANTIILLFLFKVKKKSRPGTLFFCYLLLYNIVRFFLEFMRIDSTYIYTFRINAYVSLALVCIAAIFLRYRFNDKVS
jgi:phosphatidylglycerol:prolipoprotein diacylglycerol transferase